MARPRKWSQEQREAALGAYVSMGPRRAAERTGIPAPTIVEWAREAGVDSEHVSERSSEMARKAAKASHATLEENRAKVAETAMLRAVWLLEKMTSAATMAKVVPGKGIIRIDLEHPEFGDLNSLAGAIEKLVRTSQLLSGAATARIETTEAEGQLSTLLHQIAQRRPDLRVLKESA